ncbi:MAG: acylneuraminate cytidylyltransferase family protein [Candidatus Yanofskybacteria bacterium]|nr:acylneuraminate cytidylyltransferase family protein [Candidatus Yanofskybacteria bacterium]
MKTRQFPKFLAIIPARSGSKGIKHKNIKPFCGRPLIYYAIKEALKCKKLGRVIVSTDSPQYGKIAKSFGAEVPFLRPRHLAGDKSPMVDTVTHLLKRLKEEENYEPDYLVLLQTTSPLRTYKDIEKCIDLALSRKYDGVVSLCPTEQLLYTIENGFLKLLHKKDWLSSTNRQSLPATYKLNGAAVYIIKTSTFLRNKSFLKGKIAPYIMGKWRSVDLDNEEDFALAELIYRSKNKMLRGQTGLA